MDGFRIRSASFLFVDADLRDDDVITGCQEVSKEEGGGLRWVRGVEEMGDSDGRVFG